MKKVIGIFICMTIFLMSTFIIVQASAIPKNKGESQVRMYQNIDNKNVGNSYRYQSMNHNREMYKLQLCDDCWNCLCDCCKEKIMVKIRDCEELQTRLCDQCKECLQTHDRLQSCDKCKVCICDCLRDCIREQLCDQCRDRLCLECRDRLQLRNRFQLGNWKCVD